MLTLLKRLFDPKFQVLLLGILSVVAGVTEYLVGNEFIKGYPEILGVIVAINGAVLVVLKVIQSVVVGPIKRRRAAAKDRVLDMEYRKHYIAPSTRVTCDMRDDDFGRKP